jgi:hypothetical protein
MRTSPNPQRSIRDQSDSSDDADPIHDSLRPLSAFSAFVDLDRRANTERASSQMVAHAPPLPVPHKGNYYAKALDSEVTFPYSYPPTVHLCKRQIGDFDPNVMPECLITSTHIRTKICPRVRRLANEAIHDIVAQEIHLTPVKDSFTARSFKHFLEVRGMRKLSILDEVPALVKQEMPAAMVLGRDSC